jgi:peptidoglycan hydrolase-like protein with peptidoglycan-binding domain
MTRSYAAVAAVLLVLTGLLGAPASAADRAGARPWVRDAQRALNRLHCDAGPADGRIGAHTRSAVVRLQTRHGLAASGRFTRVTRRLLASGTAQRCDQRPVPAHSGTGRRVVISQAQNWVWLVGRRGRVVAQAGVVDNPAVLHRGTWRTGSYCGRAARVRLNRSGSLWLDDFVRFAPCGIGFHRIPRRMSTGEQIHPDWYLGTNLAGDSHGCIRLSRRMAERVWAFTSGRTTTVKVV